jgi:hypothetical protein
MFRYIRIAVAITAAVAICALAVLWARSYTTADRLHGRFWGDEAFLIASKEGRMTLYAFHWPGSTGGWTWETRSYAVEDEMSFPVGVMRQYESWLGFGTIGRMIYFVMPSTATLPDGSTIQWLGAAITSFDGAGVVVPDWFLLLLLSLLIAGPTIRWPPRFSTRGLLIAVTYVAVLLGLVTVLAGWATR